MGKQRDAFFAGAIYLVDVRGWPADKVHPVDPLTRKVDAPDGARLGIWACHPHDRRPLPRPDTGDVPLVDAGRFGLKHSGNRTLRAPKRSWSVELTDGDDLAGMHRLNLKSMYNDPSQMREALVWRIFQAADVPGPRHTFARLGINGTYLGLFSVIENIDKAFLRSRFGASDGNLFKTGCGDLGGATIERRFGVDGDDSGKQYISRDRDDPTYQLKSYAPGPGASSYDDLAQLARTVDGAGLSGGEERFRTDAFADSVRACLDVDSFLRWASVNVLIGSWDNYFATPANYYLYNSAGIQKPYFTFIPWDYDNSFGIDYFGTAWQYTDLLDWPANTSAYHRFNHHQHRSRIPMVTNLLANRELRRYYLDHIEHLLDTVLSPEAVDAAIGIDPALTPIGNGLWDRVSTSAYLEADSPFGWPGTGRQFLNDEVYRAACGQQELTRGNGLILGIHHYLRMRYDRARQQLQELRHDDPSGSSGATFADPTFGGPHEPPILVR